MLSPWRPSEKISITYRKREEKRVMAKPEIHLGKEEPMQGVEWEVDYSENTWPLDADFSSNTSHSDCKSCAFR